MANQSPRGEVVPAPVAAAQRTRRARAAPRCRCRRPRRARPPPREAAARPSRGALAHQGVGQGQQRLRHAVALQHGHAVAGQPVPQVGGQRSRPRHAQAQRAERGRLAPSPPGGGTWSGRRRTWCPSGAAPQDRRLVEAVEHHGGGTRGQGAEQPGAEAVHVEERQAEHEAVLGRPVPGRQQRRRPRPAGSAWVCTAPFGLPVVPTCRRSTRRRRAAGPGRRRVGCARRPGPGPRRARRTGPAAERSGRSRSHERQYRTGIGDDVVELGAGGRRADRHENGTARAARRAAPRWRGAWRGRTTAPGRPARPPARPGPPPRAAVRAVEGRRVHHRGRVPAVDQHRSLRPGRPPRRPHLRQRPTRHDGPAVAATVPAGTSALTTGDRRS